jgi:hypothetical protein
VGIHVFFGAAAAVRLRLYPVCALACLMLRVLFAKISIQKTSLRQARCMILVQIGLF